MKSKRLFSGIVAAALISGLAGCGTDGAGAGEADSTTASTDPTTVATLSSEEEEAMEDVVTQLRDIELENKEVKWLSHWDINPASEGEVKKTELEMFEKKYGGKITYIPTTWGSRYDDLSVNILGGVGVDIFPAESNNLPGGIVNGMFQSVDEYIDLDSPLWANTKSAMELYNFGGKHYQFVTNITAANVVFYNRQTLEEHSLDDPWELYESGEWNWDTFKQMLLEFVDEEEDRYGLDGWDNEKALFLSAGVPTVEAKDGRLVCNINDPTVEAAMNYQYDLYNSGLVFPMEQFSWSPQTHFMWEGGELFLITGMWSMEYDFSELIAPENLGIAPVPSPKDSDPYQSVTLDGYVLCKDASNPIGAAVFAECAVLANIDEDAIAIADRKHRDVCKWTDEFIERNKEINELAKKYPVIDLASGCSSDIASLTTDGGSDKGMRAAFNGVEWHSNREAIADTIIKLVDEVDEQLTR